MEVEGRGGVRGGRWRGGSREERGGEIETETETERQRTYKKEMTI